MNARTCVVVPFHLIERHVHVHARKHILNNNALSHRFRLIEDSATLQRQCRTFSSSLRRLQSRPLKETSNQQSASQRERATPRKPRDISDPARGPESKEDTTTDFGALNVLGATASPSTSVDVCTHDGFILDSGLRVADGDGVILLGREAFVWRPWMASSTPLSATPSTPTGSSRAESVISGNDIYNEARRKGSRDVSSLTAGIINPRGQFEIPEAAFGLFARVWPRPDLLVVGTGKNILPLAPATRKALQALGFRLEVLDTRNAASQFNLLATERGVEEVAGVMLPIGFGDTSAST